MRVFLHWTRAAHTLQSANASPESRARLYHLWRRWVGVRGFGGYVVVPNPRGARQAPPDTCPVSEVCASDTPSLSWIFQKAHLERASSFFHVPPKQLPSSLSSPPSHPAAGGGPTLAAAGMPWRDVRDVDQRTSMQGPSPSGRRGLPCPSVRYLRHG